MLHCSCSNLGTLVNGRIVVDKAWQVLYGDRRVPLMVGLPSNNDGIRKVRMPVIMLAWHS